MKVPASESLPHMAARAPTAYQGPIDWRRLVEWLEKPARVAGISAIALEVRESSAGAQAFYARLGYRTLGRLPGYYEGRESALRMGRDLGARQPITDLRWISDRVFALTRSES